MCEHTGSITMWHTGHEGGHTMHDMRRGDVPEQVPAISLPWFLDRVRRDLDLLKCDCEGGEYEIFHSLPDSYYRRIGKIIMEYHESILRREHAEFYSEFEAALRRNYSQVRTEPISPGMTMILAWRE
jgi:hypothetical protein